jgi:hypothetical protein
MCSAEDIMKNACKENNYGGKAIVFGACRSSQQIEDGRFMQRILDPTVRGRIKKMTNNEVFMKMKDNYKKTNQWLVLCCPKEMKERYFLSLLDEKCSVCVTSSTNQKIVNSNNKHNCLKSKSLNVVDVFLLMLI